LVAGGILAGATPEAIRDLHRIGDQVGLAFQIRDDLLGMFGHPEIAGKPCDSDLIQGKRTFPLIAAYQRASKEARKEFDTLWSAGSAHNGSAKHAQKLLTEHGGRAAAERTVLRASKSARKVLRRFPADNPFRRLIDELIDLLARRDY
jgi:geranylgeranyl diphosphate synthase type I